ncbi:Y-family DNA polymerase [Panacibacter ginsenosidivorans]|uniref:Y-family DNA polymerase n=1 Tax=Panacibacter ginsenosidivorans TaxID=1813871 RepID=A0A5B8VEF0_9BACT|nr:Y-family DNA polymerase [Panacibacter ginsenosidivorans]QEC69351.1 Y-family DNA polymerase [Panacibacter ginsenosidivorans]
MYALVDCNNFYCSCERLFAPKLENHPVVVLSNNDGCAIARSEEAKALGIQMGTPEYMIRDTLQAHNVKVFSSNYTLYGDISDRVMRTLETFVSKMELYSIDEAFLDMNEMIYQDLLQLGIDIRRTIKKNIGIPVTVGIANTKTLSKMANRYAKKIHKDVGVYWAANKDLTDRMLEFTEVADIWGIGAQYAKLLTNNGFKTAKDFVQASDDWVRQHMSVVGLRLLHELRGQPSIEWEYEAPPKKNICTSRSFGTLITDKKTLEQAVANYTASCALKLRNQKSCTREIQVFLKTNQFRVQDKQYSAGRTVKLPVATNSTPELIKYALKGLNLIYRPGYNYQKCGVIVMDIIPQEQIQYSLFDNEDRKKQKTVSKTLDKINIAFGKDLVRYAKQGYEKRYKLRAEYLSKRYTTNIDELPLIKI